MSRPRSSDPALGVSEPWEEVAVLAVGILRGGQTTERPLLPVELGPGSKERQAPPLKAHVWGKCHEKIEFLPNASTIVGHFLQVCMAL